MSAEIFIDKYVKQFKAMSPKYDVVYEVSKDEPIVFEDSSIVKLSFAAIADTHLPDRESAEKNLENTFFDIFNSKEKIDALLMAGDIADYGFNSEYNRFFGVFDKYRNKIKLLVTMGNHDARFFFNKNSKIVMKKVKEYLGLKTDTKTYYSCDINGYTFIVLSTEKRVLEKAHINPEQIAFLDSELKRGTKDGKPCFVMCHQPFAFTHGLPEVWKTGDMGEQNDEVRAVMEKYKNVFFINGHLHGGVCDKVEAVLNKENNVVSISIPGYRKENNFGITDAGVGYYCEVYSDKVIFKARNFLTGKNVTGEYTRFEYKLLP
ncbi:MAG: metallophosphoesterase [Clostridia bacterium]|nr:metallophosphoesterase [Clostridia bacterium]